MCIWVKVPTSLIYPSIQYGNLEVGTYVRDPIYGNYNANAELGGYHYYHAFRLPNTGTWVKVTIDTHPVNRRSEDPNIEWDSSHPLSSAPGYNYFDLITRFYWDCFINGNVPLTSLPGNFYFGGFELYQETGNANIAQVHSFCSTYVAASNRLIVNWRRLKNDETTKHEVRYAFSDIYTLGWDNAIPAPSGILTPSATGAYAGMGYDNDTICLLYTSDAADD